jgi:subtilisin family serine protease
VTNGANVISMSFGGGSCMAGGVDPDPVEAAAITEALNHDVVVVAAAGNDGIGTKPEAPACDAGVIAVGASALADGNADGTHAAGVLGSAATPVEYVASYSNVGGSQMPGIASAWGIVAPGGDAASDMDYDNLHWIENIWTSTPFMATAGDMSFEGECTDDYPYSTAMLAPVDCRTLIEGTSMATPHVAGAAALILSVNASYQSPTLMKQLLCTTADNISDPSQGCGRLNVYRAMAHAVGDTNPP